MKGYFVKVMRLAASCLSCRLQPVRLGASSQFCLKSPRNQVSPHTRGTRPARSPSSTQGHTHQSAGCCCALLPVRVAASAVHGACVAAAVDKPLLVDVAPVAVAAAAVPGVAVAAAAAVAVAVVGMVAALAVAAAEAPAAYLVEAAACVPAAPFGSWTAARGRPGGDSQERVHGSHQPLVLLVLVLVRLLLAASGLRQRAAAAVAGHCALPCLPPYLQLLPAPCLLTRRLLACMSATGWLPPHAPTGSYAGHHCQQLLHYVTGMGPLQMGQQSEESQAPWAGPLGSALQMQHLQASGRGLPGVSPSQLHHQRLRPIVLMVAACLGPR